MSPQDASFLHVEDSLSPMHIGAVSIFEGEPPRIDEFQSLVASKLSAVPRYRQKVQFVPLGLGRPVWVDDPDFHLSYHVRQTALPRPGGEQQLRNLVGRVMAQHLDRTKPLWEMWVVEGLDLDHWALVSKVHHCMVDGVSGTDLLAVILDPTPEPAAPSVPAVWRADSEPSRLRLAADAVAALVTDPYEQMRAARAAIRAPRQAAANVVQLGRGLRSLSGLARPTARTGLNGPIGPHRRWAWARATLADVKIVRSKLGGTVNDVVLAMISCGFRELLRSRGLPLEGQVVRTMVPVSVRTQDERGTYNNRVSAMFADLPVGIADPAERLASIRGQMDGLKDSRQAVAGEVLASLSGFAPPLLLAMGARLAFRIPQRNINTVTTNVPGPQQPIYACGRRMIEAFPFVPLARGVRIAIAIFSYDGSLNFGVTGDYDHAPDISVLCQGIEDGLSELMKLA
ncbi:MAG: WS/DGAT/MGAT family O-acyltransferase [Acidimicrobiales bacterium]